MSLRGGVRRPVSRVSFDVQPVIGSGEPVALPAALCTCSSGTCTELSLPRALERRSGGEESASRALRRGEEAPWGALSVIAAAAGAMGTTPHRDGWSRDRDRG